MNPPSCEMAQALARGRRPHADQLGVANRSPSRAKLLSEKPDEAAEGYSRARNGESKVEPRNPKANGTDRQGRKGGRFYKNRKKIG